MSTRLRHAIARNLEQEEAPAIRMNHVHKISIARIQTHTRWHALEIRFRRIEASDPCQIVNQLTSIACGVRTQRMPDQVQVLRLQSMVLLQLLDEKGQLQAHQSRVGCRLRVQGEGATCPVHDDDIQIAPGNQFIAHIGDPIGQWRVNEAVNNELGAPLRVEVGVDDGLVVFRHQQLGVRGILLGEQQEPGVYHCPGQRKYVEWPVDEVVPLAGNVQASYLTKASGLVFNCMGFPRFVGREEKRARE